MTSLRAVCVFCGSSSGANPRFTLAAEELGRVLAARGIGLVYGGASVGLMGVVADAVIAGGGTATGVITEALAGHEIAHGALSDLHVVSTMHQRKALMSDLSDAFVMLPGGVGHHEQLELARLDESLVRSVGEEAEEVVEEPVGVQQPATLVVDAELGPGDRLHELFERAEAAGQHDERIGQVRHERLALVHGRHHMQVAQGPMGDLVTRERLGDDPDDPAARCDHGVRHHAHQTHRGAAVDEADPPRRQLGAESLRREREARIGAGARAAEDADVAHGRHAVLACGTGTGSASLCAGRISRRRTIVAAASLSWIESEKTTAARANPAAVRKAR